MQSILQEKEFLHKTQAAIEAETVEIFQVSTRLHDNLMKAFRLMWRQLFVIWAVVIILGLTVFLVVRKGSLPSTVDARGLAGSGQQVINPVIDAVSQAPATQTSLKPGVVLEEEKVRHVLEQIRRAQLNKDINLFMKAYAPGFPNLSQKKGSVLKTWKHYNYLDLRFHITDMQHKDAQTVIARVSWDITLQDLQTRRTRNLVRNFIAEFSKCSGKWRLQELTEGIDPRYARQG